MNAFRRSDLLSFLYKLLESYPVELPIDINVYFSRCLPVASTSERIGILERIVTYDLPQSIPAVEELLFHKQDNKLTFNEEVLIYQAISKYNGPDNLLVAPVKELQSAIVNNELTPAAFDAIKILQYIGRPLEFGILLKTLLVFKGDVVNWITTALSGIGRRALSVPGSLSFFVPDQCKKTYFAASLHYYYDLSPGDLADKQIRTWLIQEADLILNSLHDSDSEVRLMACLALWNFPSLASDYRSKIAKEILELVVNASDDEKVIYQSTLKRFKSV